MFPSTLVGQLTNTYSHCSKVDPTPLASISTFMYGNIPHRDIHKSKNGIKLKIFAYVFNSKGKVSGQLGLHNETLFQKVKEVGWRGGSGVKSVLLMQCTVYNALVPIWQLIVFCTPVPRGFDVLLASMGSSMYEVHRNLHRQTHTLT